MNIADKLTTIAENEQKVYDAGYKVGETEGEQKGYLSGKEEGYNEGYNAGEKDGYNVGHSQGSIDGYNKGYTEGKEDGVTEGHTIGYNEGQQAQYDLMWNGLQNNGNTADYQRKFLRINYGYAAWDLWYNPKYDFKHKNSGSAIDTFRECHVKDVIKDNYAYSGGMQFMYTFYQSTRLENARTIHVYENTTYTDPFGYCSGLKEVRFEGVIAQNGLKFSACTKLSKASIESVINALSSTTSGLTVTFSKVAVDTAFETSVGAVDGSISIEWTKLVATKSNWTIALV